MESVGFKQANIKIAEHQEEYETIHAKVVPNDPQGKVTFCMKLSDAEKKHILEHGTLWVEALTFRNPFMPILILAEPPEGCSQPE